MGNPIATAVPLRSSSPWEHQRKLEWFRTQAESYTEETVVAVSWQVPARYRKSEKFANLHQTYGGQYTNGVGHLDFISNYSWDTVSNIALLKHPYRKKGNSVLIGTDSIVLDALELLHVPVQKQFVLQVQSAERSVFPTYNLFFELKETGPLLSNNVAPERDVEKAFSIWLHQRLVDANYDRNAVRAVTQKLQKDRLIPKELQFLGRVLSQKTATTKVKEKAHQFGRLYKIDLHNWL